MGLSYAFDLASFFNRFGGDIAQYFSEIFRFLAFQT
jgi:hypothetical protein